jgi:choline dehydrogenase-like flavoprotein
MIRDFNEGEQSQFHADVCVVGSGAAGLTCASEFAESGLKVIVLEGGGQIANPQNALIHQADITGLPHSGIHNARERCVGGTTTTWGGQALPFMAEDFHERPWMKNSGWPLHLLDLEPLYRRAEKVLGVDESVPFDARPWKAVNVDEPNFDSDTLELFVSKWCQQPNFAKLYRGKIERSTTLTLLYHANVTEICLESNGQNVETLRINSLDGREGSVQARHFILAGGAIETARLLLASNRIHKNGVANANDLVGRYFQDHTASVVGLFQPTSRSEFADIIDPFYIRGHKYFPRVRLSPKFASKNGTLHASVQLVIQDSPDSVMNLAKNVAKRWLRSEISASLIADSAKVFRSPTEFLSAIYRFKWKNRGVSSLKRDVWIEVQSEQEPDADSRVTLSKRRDALGMPRVALNWSVSKKTSETIRKTAMLFAEQSSKSGLGTAILENWILEDSDHWVRYIGDVYHQCGTTRMDNDPQKGVVDKQCKVHGIGNLHIASSSVFPTSSFSNPTMTIIALAIGICDRVKTLLSAG